MVRHKDPPLASRLKGSVNNMMADKEPMNSYYGNIEGTRSLPIHCIIEQTSGPPSFDVPSNEKSAHTSVELDSYAILPSSTPISECVQSALVKLGYNSAEVLGAKGAIQIKNWKPLSFDTIAENQSSNIEDLLGELTQVVTLRIRICSNATKLTSAEEVKERLLQLLLSQSQGLMQSTGCTNMDKNGLYQNGQQQTLATISPEMRRAFDKWYEEQLKSYTDGSAPNNVNLASVAKELLAVQQQKISTVLAGTGNAHDTLSSAGHDLSIGQALGHSQALLGSQLSQSVSRPKASSTPTTEPFSHPAYQHYLPGKTRMRTSFDPEHEIPRLQRWFLESQHPSRDQMIQYLNELNSLDSRKGRRPLDLTNIIYWFKNARAAHRRATKNSSDDSFEMEEDKDLFPTNGESIPFLPNRNAVYMVPYPQFSNIGLNSHALGLLSAHGKLNGHIQDREPCDLSLNGSRSRSPNNDNVSKKSKCESAPYNGKENDKSVSDKQSSNERMKDKDEEENVDIDVEKVLDKEVDSSPPRSDEGFSEMPEKSGRKSSSPKKDSSTIEIKPLVKAEPVVDVPTDLTVDRKSKPNSDSMKEDVKKERELDNEQPNDLSVKNTCKSESVYCRDLTNSNKRPYQSDDDDDDDLESDYDDDRSMDGSVSSHEDNKLSALRDSYLNSTHGLNLGVVTGSPSSQTLHIPQFPHPLAMHYFPLNTHFYSQQANQMKFHSHQQQSPTQQTMPKSSPGGGQENNSHSSRKRRTRVFIDPLSEIPKLEKWFIDDTHPSSYMIDKYCEELNSSEYRQKFPKLEPKNVQLWFKNHRAKVKRMRVGGMGDHMFV
ncbi:uncharacterized protein LOC127847056 isoform X2 [Dreissena polymorpha]|uniref:uncharacterized protein LOC127847056 isoform X2 n=1 Tax=Dreissena polymorpha TaxID=45954 RepID=UPI00226558CE|nr:uncharacterized protein LOC127847056 isoform X2 [Dreissena polymorpha]